MMRVPLFFGIVAGVLTTPLATVSTRADEPGAARELAGLWRAKRRFGPEIKGALAIEQHDKTWTTEIMGRTAPVKSEGGRISFELADQQGDFRGQMKGGRIVGHWIQPRLVTNGTAYATPIVLEKQKPGRWRGMVTPLDDEMTLYLLIKLDQDGTLRAFIRNPERNVGRFMKVEHVVCDGRKVKLMGSRSKAGSEPVVGEGMYDSENGTLSLYLPSLGGAFDFARASAADYACFLPRGKAPAPHVYRSPPEGDDGWPVATLEDVRMSRGGIARFIQTLLDTPIDSVHSSEIHGVLIARHGKLVLEEYFHGFHRDALHDTRSASKSLTSVLVGAAVLKGEPISPATPVYETMKDAAATANLDPRKRAITVENLLTMSSGLDCDDNDPASAGNEDTMQSQTAQPDWHRYTLDLRMVRAPGEKAVYGSANPNLIGGVVARATGRWLPDLFHDLVAEPLQIRSYAMNLTPTRDAYMGGGMQLLPRDFMKLGQLILDGGRWRGRQIVSGEWAKRSVSPLYELRGLHYGYLWWIADYPYKGRTVRAFFAGGNGGQIVMGIPELDLVIAFYGGNYSDPVMFVPQRVYVPEYILPAVN
jgi:CubicO group peptidase (beta-lactamase class C family)